MILIFSSYIDGSTCEVIDWLNYFGKTFLRINNGNINDHPFCVEVSNDGFRLFINGKRDSEITSIWYRRTGPSKTPELPQKLEKSLRLTMANHLDLELLALRSVFYQNLSNVKWLSHPDKVQLDKINVLMLASSVGLAIPDTLISNEKSRISEFNKRHEKIIVKNIHYTMPFKIGDEIYSTYTTIVPEAVLAEYDYSVFPATYQELIEKEYEVRVFYLNKKTYSMAIFSQGNKSTEIDFRRYSNVPNRTIPYALPLEIKEGIVKLMGKLDLNTGSLDFIKTRKGLIFLEVNPVGQFGMVSHPCNYYLEKEIAEFLSHEK